MNDYYMVVLKNGITMDFKGLCNVVDLSAKTAIVFGHKEDEGVKPLAIIPRENVAYILNSFFILLQPNLNMVMTHVYTSNLSSQKIKIINLLNIFHSTINMYLY